MFDPMKVLVETIHLIFLISCQGFPLKREVLLLSILLTFFSVNCKINLKALLSEMALTYEKARLHGARCASLSNIELDQKHLKKEKTALLAVVSSRVCMEITGHFFVYRRSENSHLPGSPRYTTKGCPVSNLLFYHKYQKVSINNSFSQVFCIQSALHLARSIRFCRTASRSMAKA